MVKLRHFWIFEVNQYEKIIIKSFGAFEQNQK